ncbi:glycoside hydrolase domain-containing protein [Fructilactobacillus fructivorans]|uniref:glycoside hydrolase domain-containing protein n=1 Tax=Fructilactobacillus fructivorans TaxID=1614 RepID=UPI0007054287|nr:glycoside hydrolase domain-containing protein [Fructilactobacillus fructivorans]KRN41201.1 peptidoglycan binding domain protein [Fructilactobacillus fructivorans]KRN43016.1 peptidoglycan binding domain protein [Fructilactobacillus fructivorans]
MDQQVLNVQKWLNQEYGNVSGFDKVKENGNTGWPTIYALRMGLQHELGISPLGSGFGDKTKKALSGMVDQLKVGYKGKIAKLIQGAFWCKGISPNAFDEKYTKDTQNAVNTLRNDAGLDKGGVNVPLMAGLFDMAAFELLDGGKNNYRQMQQYLNHNYLNYFGNDLGLVPTDGLYQRNTNTALIYALQAVEGMTPVQANGVYGPGTINKTPTLTEGDKGAGVKLLQYGLMVNDFLSGSVDGVFNNSVAEDVVNFRKFMNLPPFTGKVDLTVIKGLLTSNGNTNRDSNACDTSFQLSDKDVKNIKNYGFEIVGRYLTGSVGTGSKRRSKNLTDDELKRITDGGLKVFPIYQDNDGSQEYFNYGQGCADAGIANATAQRLGFPKSTIIYFAVDTDIQAGDIDSTVIPYMEGVKKALGGSNYQLGIYGTRNVCAQTLSKGLAKAAFVSDMSTGYSGNLGYQMPKDWAIDQFVEYSLGDIAIDQDASSGRDNGTNEIKPTGIGEMSAKDALKNIVDNTQVEIDVPWVIYNDNKSLKITLVGEGDIKPIHGSGLFTISNGALPLKFMFDWVMQSCNNNINAGVYIVSLFNKWEFVQKIEDGQVSIEIVETKDGWSISVEFNIFKLKINNKSFDTELSISIDIDSHPHNYPDFKSYEKSL